MPQVRIRDGGGTLRTITRIRVRDSGNVLRTVQRIRIRDASNVLRTVFDMTSGSLAFASVPFDVSENRFGAGSITSPAATGSAIGGTGPYTYAYTYVSGDVFTINTPTASSTTFTTTLSADTIKQGVYRLTITDAAAATISADFNVTLEAFP